MNNLICSKCGKDYSLNEPLWKCKCGGLLDIDFESSFPIEKIVQRKPTLWRYREAIPIQDDKNIITFDEGFTPLVKVKFQDKDVFVKQDHLFQTGSFKDRGASVLISKAKELGILKVVEDSSGNAGSAIAAYCSKAKLKCEIYVPAETSPAKLAQISSYAATVNKIVGTREDAANAAFNAAEYEYYASHYWNPFFFEGTKTFAYEVCEQLNWVAPETVILPVGNGTLALGAYIGFNDLLAAGIINKVPKLIGVQARNCAPLFEAFKEDRTEIPKVEKKESVAEGISIAEPVRGQQILEAIRKTQGEIIAVEEAEIKMSLLEINEKGFYIEPTCAVTIAGIKNYLETSDPGEQIVSTFTGHGLKTSEKIMKILNK